MSDNHPLGSIQTQPQSTYSLPATKAQPEAQAAAKKHPFQAVLASQQTSSLSNSHKTSSAQTTSGLVHLGQISTQASTVSHLLVNHPDFRSSCWSIVHAPVNQDKPYRQLGLGQDVWLHPKTQEIVFTNGKIGPESGASHISNEYDPVRPAHPATKSRAQTISSESGNRSLDQAPGSPDTFFTSAVSFSKPTLEERSQENLPSSNALTQAVAAYRGQPYSAYDCYELVVQGLKDLGIQYSGQEGLQNALIQQARMNNLPMNAYLTGEGLIHSLGQSVSEKTVMPKTDNVSDQVSTVYTALQKRLEPGLILSFSTRSRGHTGVIASTDSQWTFINSGQIDHSIHPGESGQQVGEEYLVQELTNWMQRAAREGSHLQISLGRLEKEKVLAYLPPSQHRA